MSNNPAVLEHAINMSMWFMTDQVPYMSVEDRSSTKRLITDHLTDQDLATYSTLKLVNYLRDLLGDYLEMQDDKDGNWEE